MRYTNVCDSQLLYNTKCTNKIRVSEFALKTLGPQQYLTNSYYNFLLLTKIPL